MAEDVILPVSPSTLRTHVQTALGRYWPQGRDKVEAMPVAEAMFPLKVSLPRFVLVPLPEWAVHCGVDGSLLVPEEACALGQDWRYVDWWLASFLMLECWHERAWENTSGSIHSYSFRLREWDARVWERAWVNRIALFLRAWASHDEARTEQDLFGPVPQVEIVVTHDVDAVAKTLPIRLKQCAFNLFNAGRFLAGGNPLRSAASINQAARFLFLGDDWWTLDNLLDMEQQAGIRSHFNFYADNRKKNMKRWIFDPGYDVASDRLFMFMRAARAQGSTIGLHPSFDTWQDSMLLQAQKETLEAALGYEVISCRQHWLRFSWRDTWAAQEKAGLGLDTTLMFNDRPGFRSSAALQWRPWNAQAGTNHALQALTTVLMDSHLYDYQPMTDDERKSHITGWLDEIRKVGGQAALLWHPHTLTKTFGWQTCFYDLLQAVNKEPA